LSPNEGIRGIREFGGNSGTESNLKFNCSLSPILIEAGLPEAATRQFHAARRLLLVVEIDERAGGVDPSGTPQRPRRVC